MTPSIPAVGDVIAEKYRIASKLGEGGMGLVYRAHHELMERDVALKYLQPHLLAHPEIRERFVLEARAAAMLNHPNVVEVFDVGSAGGSLFIVMEFLEGESFCCLSCFSTAVVPRSTVSPPADSPGLRGHLRTANEVHKSERPARACM